jgi:aspartyl-tRNA(Asn)/glutamyl-tRNA(Gln) amidotransferase subunit A
MDTKSIKALQTQLNQKKLTLRELVDFFLDKVSEMNPILNAFINFPGKIEQDAYEHYLHHTDPGLPLYGIPIAVKDNIAVKGLPMTAGSRILEGYTSSYDATVVEKIKHAGAWILGKTNMDEFAMGSSNEFSSYGNVKNPFNHEYVPGGSSGGSACAVASGLSPLALGSDTGGSIRQPASYCGVVGIRPTRGLVSRYGLCSFSSSLDEAGPMARHVDDAFYLLSIIAGHDPRDSQSFHIEYHQLPEDTSCKTFGVIGEIEDMPMEKEVREAYEKLKNSLQASYRMKVLHLNSFRYGLAAYHVICDAEAMTNLGRYDGLCFARKADQLEDNVSSSAMRTKLFGKEVKRRMLLGAFVLSSHTDTCFYSKALYARSLIAKEMEELLQASDFILTPPTPSTAFRFGEKKDPLMMYNTDICTIPSALAGLPSVSLPFGKNSKGLPIGMQLIGARFSEKKLHHVAREVEQNHE